MKHLFPLSVLALSAAGLAACGGTSASNSSATGLSAPTVGSSSDSVPSSEASSSQEVIVPKVAYSFIDSKLVDGNYGDGSWNAYVYQADLYDNGVYRYTETTMTYGYSMMLSTSAIMNYGTYTKGATEDGVTEYTLNAAAEVFLNAYSKAGGFSIVVETPTQEYPVELPAKQQGEKNMANSKQEVINECGLGKKIYADESKFVFTTLDPDTDEEGEPVTTPSGDVSSVLKDVNRFEIVNEFANPGSMGEGSWDGTVHIATIYDDNSYNYMTTSIKYGYSMLLSTTTVVAEGKATIGASEDDYTKVTLGVADEVLLNSNSKAGGFNIQINTINATYPVEMPAKAQGEKNMANSKQDVIDAYGASKALFLSDSTGTMSLVNPNE
ncbi:MAG: hypothetical protein J6A47_04010 [Bacilli bacterium]|nr:hypothetical protein [Bacilli bacterium]MBO6284867.1 hypothetical protein [Bacilli bacterium]